jgi:CBS domain-containing protein
MALLAEHRLHRLHVTDERQRPVGIVTITDLLRVIVGFNDLLEALGPVSKSTAILRGHAFTGAAGGSAGDPVLIY